MQFQFELLRDALVVAACAALLIWGIVVAGHTSLAAKPNPNGAYDVTLGGDGHGSGKAVVAAKKVKIDGTLNDGHGNVRTLSAPKLSIDSSSYRFSGTGTLDAQPISISGRIDPPDDPNNLNPGNPKLRKNWRISATFVTADGKCAGRVLGER
jgi:hypothetical protein